MADEGVRVDGVPQVVHDLQRLSLDLDDLSSGLTTLGRQAAAGARMAAPRRTGDLARSITSSTKGNRVTVSAGNTRIGYARYVNFGTRRMSAHDFMHRADDVLRAGAEQQITRSLNTAIARAGLS